MKLKHAWKHGTHEIKEAIAFSVTNTQDDGVEPTYEEMITVLLGSIVAKLHKNGALSDADVLDLVPGFTKIEE